MLELSSKHHMVFWSLLMFLNLIVYLMFSGDDCSWKIAEHSEALTK